MSDQVEHTDGGTNGTGTGLRPGVTLKKNRVRSCDQCRRRKVRCNAGESVLVGSPCPNCIESGIECTYVAASENRFRDLEYVKGIENELAELKARLREMEAEKAKECLAPARAPAPSISVFEQDIVENLEILHIKDTHQHFWGKSSSFVFTRAAAMALRQDGEQSDGATVNAEGFYKEHRRPSTTDDLAWMLPPTPPHPPEAFPPQPLMSQLLDGYFEHLNYIYPILHRPTFEREMRAGLHLADEAFGSVVLLACAIGARFSSDPAVLPRGTQSWHWAGWEWAQRVNSTRRLAHLAPPRYYDLQIANLLAYYIVTSPAPYAAYTLMGYGVRLAQDMGAHRRSTYAATPTVEDELKKRNFWCLVLLDRGMCQKLGRPYSFHDDEINADFPTECDDEYWENENPELAFKQPEGKPSSVAIFNQCLLIGRMHGRALQTIYSPQASALRSDPGYAQKVVSELDSEMNEFIDSIPEHLKWDPNHPDVEIMKQSAVLHSHFYHLQITVHRAFIPLPGKPSPIDVPSLAICTNAARSCIRMKDMQYARMGTLLHLHLNQMSLFSASVILLLNIWSTLRASPTADVQGDFTLVQKAMRMLQILEPRFRSAGRICEILNELIAIVCARFIPSPSNQRPQKRPRDDVLEEPDSAQRPAAPGSTAFVDPTMRKIPPGTTTVEADQGTSSAPVHSSVVPQSEFDFAMPVYDGTYGMLPAWPAATPSISFGEDASQDFDPVAFTEGMAMPDVWGAGDANLAQIGFDPDFEAVFANLVHEGSFGAAFRHGNNALNWRSQGGSFPDFPDLTSNSDGGVSSTTNGNTYASSGGYGQSVPPGSSVDGRDFLWR